MGALLDAYRRLQAGSLWSSTGRCRGFAVSNPGEVKLLDAYVTALDAGDRPAPPTLATSTGEGIAGMLAALAPPPVPVPVTGKLIGFATGAAADTYTGMDAANRARYLDTVKAVGGNVIRFDCDGSADEQALIGDAKAKGVEVIPIVMQLGDPALYAARAKAVVAVGKPLGVTRYELGNEVNLHMDTCGQPERWAATSNAAYDAIKAIDPFAIVACSGIAAYGQYGSQDATHMDMQYWFERAVEAGMKLNAAAAHPYHYVLPPSPSQATAAYLLDLSVPSNGYAQTVSLQHSIRATLDTHGMSDAPIWITEVGVPTKSATWADGYDEQVVADYRTGLLARVRAEPRITVFCWYSLRDRPSAAANREGGFGLLRADWSPKAAAHVV